MCLSTIYLDSCGEPKQFMQDIARMEAESEGFTLIDLFGKKTFVQGKIKSIDFIEEHSVLLEQKINKHLKKCTAACGIWKPTRLNMPTR
jgi:predicted RNA-binding protein